MKDKLDMTDLERDLVALIGARRGEKNAVSRRELVKLLSGIGERRIRRCLKHLVDEHGIPIASGPGGYYTPVTAKEIARACEYYHSYAIACLAAESRLRRCSMEEILGQLKLDYAKR